MGKEITFTGMKAISGKDTWPQVFINGQHIGGSDELAEFFNK